MRLANGEDDENVELMRIQQFSDFYRAENNDGTTKHFFQGSTFMLRNEL